MLVKYCRSRISVTACPRAASSSRHSCWVAWSGTRKAMWCTVPPAVRPGCTRFDECTSTSAPGSPSPAASRVRLPSCSTTRIPRSLTMRAIVCSASRTVSTLECWPRIACLAGTLAESHGSRGSCSCVATSSICRPSGSSASKRSSLEFVDVIRASAPTDAKWSTHQPSDPAGTEKAVEVDWPAPMRPGWMPRHGKKVMRVPGRPNSSP